ncbi:uncharacterized protein LOC129613193 [Condylostylus longicornis]|uniref:uncharacterized protein LOC129613193 n=1 Tax=Condylostylus longicornis TaxID=2530218 RepID=UPI00244E1D8E|nr:uncharacterized protein LOC129613193 [Condylostylus longicornis]
MEIINLGKFNFISIYTLFLLIFIIKPTLGLISCPKQYIYQIGTRTICSLGNDTSVSCDSPYVKDALVSCADGYFNHLHKQLIICDFNTGKWSEIPYRCFPPCLPGYPGENPLLDKETLLGNRENNRWYAEILRRPPINGEQNVIPAGVLSAKMIFVWEKYFDRNSQHDFSNYLVRVYKTRANKLEPEDYRIERIVYLDNDPVYTSGGTPELERFCILILSKEKYIEINQELGNFCVIYDGKTELWEKYRWYIEVMKARPENNLMPQYPDKCIVPHVEKRKIDIMCYSNLLDGPLPECSQTANVLQTKCQIGHMKRSSMNDDVISACVAGRWIIDDADGSDCELICGESEEFISETITPLIHGGRQATIRRAPWHAGIYTNSTQKLHELICAGSIIHRNIVISAAHCFYDSSLKTMGIASDYIVGAGKLYHNFSRSEDSEQFVRVSEIHIIRTYDSQKLKNDVSVLVVNPEFIYNSHVKPVCIDWTSYFEYDLKSGTVGHIFGWGATDQNNFLSEELLTVDFKTLSSEQCRKLDNRSEATAENFCGTNDKGATACKGDSGGGFVVKRTIGGKERYTLWGVISSGIGYESYCTEKSLTIFTNIQYFQEPIKAIITKSRRKLNSDKLTKIIWHKIFAHDIWAAPNWVEDELNLKLTSNPEQVRLISDIIT